MSRSDFISDCSVSVTGEHDEGSRRDGCCTWCGRRFQGPAPRPNLDRWVTDLGFWYGIFYDPDDYDHSLLDAPW